MSGHDDVDLTPGFRALKTAYPGAPKAELRRFARKFREKPQEAVVRYADYKTWRTAQGSPTALARAHSMIKPPQSFWISSTTSQGRAKDGTPIIFLELARIDVTLHSEDVYVHALCHLTDEAFSCEEEGHMTVVMDCRGGNDWPNPSPMTLVPFLKAVLKVLPKMYPDRTKRFLVYPVPWVAAFIVSMVKKMLEPETREKLVLIAGDRESLDCPADALNEYLTIESLPVRVWERHKALDPKKVSMTVEVPKKEPPNDDEDGESFYSLSEGDNEEIDVESGLLEVDRSPCNRVPTGKQFTEQRELKCFRCNRRTSPTRLFFRCMFCYRRKRVEDPRMQ